MHARLSTGLRKNNNNQGRPPSVSKSSSVASGVSRQSSSPPATATIGANHNQNTIENNNGESFLPTPATATSSLVANPTRQALTSPHYAPSSSSTASRGRRGGGGHGTSSASPMPAWSRYRKLETIGAGAFGVAYLAVEEEEEGMNDGDNNNHHHENGSPSPSPLSFTKKSGGEKVVVKRMFLQGLAAASGGRGNSEQSASANSANEVMKAAATEVRVLQQITPHPNIIAYRDHFVDDEGYINIVMEYCPGGDLEQLIRQRCCCNDGDAAHKNSTALERGGAEELEEETPILGKPFTLEEVLFIAFQLLAALKHLHGCGIIHRDLKPSNIFICPSDARVSCPREGAIVMDEDDDDYFDGPENGEDKGAGGGEEEEEEEEDAALDKQKTLPPSKMREGKRRRKSRTHQDRVASIQRQAMDNSITGMTLKLADFGISKVLEHTNAAAKTVIGTPFYLSPQLCNDEPYTSAADVWSLGCIIYEVASGCGAKCFGGDNLLAIARKICSGVVPHLPQNPSMDMLLRPLLLGMLCPEEAMRLTAAQVLHQFFYTNDTDFAEDFEDPEDDF